MGRNPGFSENVSWVTVDLNPDDRMDISCAVVKKNGKICQIKEEVVFDTIRALAKHWAGLPIVLQIGGKGCLTKSLTKHEDGLIGEDIIQRVLPNANSHEFAFQLCISEDSPVYAASIIRQSTLNEVLRQFLAEGVVVKRLVLGHHTFPENQEHEDAPSLLYIKDADKKIPQWIQTLHALENGIIWATTKVASPELVRHEGEMKFFRLTKKALIIVPILLLATLVGNVLWYNHLESRYVNSEAKIEASRSELDSIALLEGMLQEQARVLGSANGFSSIPASYYSDRIGQSISGGITLNRLDIFPMMVNTESGKVEKLKYDTIVVEGLSNNSSSLNTWVSHISKLPWISGVNILDYKQVNTAEDGEFELLITCR